MRPVLLLIALVGCSEPGLRALEYAPEITIVSPTADTVYPVGAPVPFVARVELTDRDSVVEDLIVTWRSDLHGDLTPDAHTIDDGTVSFVFDGVLELGTHHVSVEAVAANGTDPGTDDSVLVVVEDTAPTAAFTTPDEGVYAAFDAPLVVEARVSDAEQGADTLTLTWTLDGQPVADAPAAADVMGVVRHTFDGFALGEREIRLVVTDNAGVTASASLGLHAVEPDADEDGFVAAVLGGSDCDDTDASVFPGAAEVCNDRDDDCDTLIDDDDGDLDPTSAGTWFPDGDADSFGDATSGLVTCEPPSGWILDGGDCADADAARNPDAAELCNGGVDDDCDGLADDLDADVLATDVWYPDVDGDGFGDEGAPGVVACEPAPYEVGDASDCDDGDGLAFPGAVEVCDGVGRDEDCDGRVDDLDDSLDLATRSSWWPDDDADGHGDLASAPALACDAPPGWEGSATDCDDGLALVNPDALEVCNGLRDDDCDGLADDADPDLELASADTWYRDLDADGFGDPGVSMLACVGAAPLWIADATDCDDADGLVHPAAPEVCNGVDDDCDLLADDDDPNVADGDPAWIDFDGDSWGDDASEALFCAAPPGRVHRGGDCDDRTGAVNPGATEVCNADDDDCDALVDDEDPSLSDPAAPGAGLYDGDADTWGVWRDSICDLAKLATSGPDEDCNDLAADINPGIVEDGALCQNGYDDDCSGDVASCRYEGEYVIETDLLVSEPAAVLRGDDGSRLGGSMDAWTDGLGSTTLIVGATGHGGSDIGAAFVWTGAFVPGAEYDLSTADVQLLGVENNADFGTAVALGDLDADGVLDFVASAPDADDAAGDPAGAVYVFSGDSGASVRTAADADWVLVGEASNAIAGAALRVGDLSCDGIDDLIVTSPGTTVGFEGTVYVFFGPLALSAPRELSLAEANVVITGEAAGDRLGDSVDLAGDLSGTAPGCDGLIVGAERWGTGTNNRGSAYLFAADDSAWHGLDATAAPISIDASSAWAAFRGVGIGYVGAAAAGLGDIDASGRPDVAIGAPLFNDDATGNPNEGRVYWILDPEAGDHDLDGAVPLPNVVVVRNAESGGAAGSAVANVGDLDGDGFDELAATAVDHDGGGVSNTGGAYVFYGGAPLAAGALQDVSDAGFLGEAADHLGEVVAGLGDVDGDGVDDMAFTSADNDEGGAGSNHGAVFVIFGTNQ